MNFPPIKSKYLHIQIVPQCHILFDYIVVTLVLSIASDSVENGEKVMTFQQLREKKYINCIQKVNLTCNLVNKSKSTIQYVIKNIKTNRNVINKQRKSEVEVNDSRRKSNYQRSKEKSKDKCPKIGIICLKIL